VVGTFLIGCAFLLLAVGCSGTSSEATKEGQGHTEASKEQTRSAEATEAEEARCDGTRTIKDPEPGWPGTFVTNDLPGCPKGGLLEGNDKHNHMVDQLAGKDGDDEIRGLGGPDSLLGGPGNDVIYGGPGGDYVFCGSGHDEVFLGGGRAGVYDGSCEKVHSSSKGRAGNWQA
jgi:RTX calcium-binding nonapeptide repeat (4 copies)